MSGHFRGGVKDRRIDDDLPLGQQQPSMRLFHDLRGKRHAEKGADYETDKRTVETDDL